MKIFYITFVLKTKQTHTFKMSTEGVAECLTWFLNEQPCDIRVGSDGVGISADSVAHIAIA